MPPAPSPASKVVRLVRLLIWNLVFLAVIACGVEGVASYLLLGRDVMTTHPLAERLHTQYDAELGWINRPNVYIQDVYGPGLYVRTNAAGLRADRNYAPSAPAGTKRVLCSGDSFTFGWGVDNEHAWCHLLGVLSPGLETLNMGLGGYGIDQMYLSYKRDGLRFSHQVHVMAFITQDILRMQSDTFVMYGKPVIEVENGGLVVKNVPVPRSAYRWSWLVSQVENFERLRTWELIRRVGRKIGGSSSTASGGRDLSVQAQDAKTRLVLAKVLDDLKHLNAEHGSVFVLVYLPILDEIPGDRQPPWIDFVEQLAGDLGVPFISVLDAFRQLPAHRAAQMFIRPGEVRFPGAAGHLNQQGNAFVADVIHRAVLADPQIAHALALR